MHDVLRAAQQPPGDQKCTGRNEHHTRDIQVRYGRQENKPKAHDHEVNNGHEAGENTQLSDSFSYIENRFDLDLRVRGHINSVCQEDQEI